MPAGTAQRLTIFPTTARGTEAYLLLWVRMFGALGTADFNMKVMR